MLVFLLSKVCFLSSLLLNVHPWFNTIMGGLWIDLHLAAATVASQWLELLHQDIKCRVSGDQQLIFKIIDAMKTTRPAV